MFPGWVVGSYDRTFASNFKSHAGTGDSQWNYCNGGASNTGAEIGTMFWTLEADAPSAPLPGSLFTGAVGDLFVFGHFETDANATSSWNSDFLLQRLSSDVNPTHVRIRVEVSGGSCGSAAITFTPNAAIVARQRALRPGRVDAAERLGGRIHAAEQFVDRVDAAEHLVV